MGKGGLWGEQKTQEGNMPISQLKQEKKTSYLPSFPVPIFLLIFLYPE